MLHLKTASILGLILGLAVGSQGCHQSSPQKTSTVSHATSVVASFSAAGTHKDTEPKSNFLLTWRVSREEAEVLYKNLRVIASLVQDAVRSGQQDEKAPASFDSILSQDDMTLALRGSEINRNNLVFHELVGDKVPSDHSSIEDLALFYKGMVWLDEQDGLLDGAIAGNESSLEVPIIIDPMLHAVEQYRRGVFSVRVEMRSGEAWEGTAWVADREVLPDGSYQYYLISNAHVMDEVAHEEMRWIAWDSSHENKYDIHVLGVDHDTDISVSTLVTRDEFPVLKMASSVPLAGSPIAILGNQKGRGIIYLAGAINNPANFAYSNEFPVIHHDVSSSNGNSGSPVFNEKGLVIGTHFQGDKSGSANIGFAIPIYVFRETYEKLRQEGIYRHGATTGAYYVSLTQEELQWMGVDAKSAYYVNRVLKGWDSDLAGLTPGDIILSIDGKPVPQKDWQAAEYQLFQKKPGDFIDLTLSSVLNPKQIRTLHYTNTGAINPILKTWETPYGFSVLDLQEQEKKQLLTCGTQASQGVTLRFEADDDEDPFPGLQAGMVVSHLNGREVKDVAGFQGIFNEESEKAVPLVADFIGVNGSGLNLCQRARLLLSGLSQSRQTLFGKAGMYAVKLSKEEQVPFGITSPMDEAYLVTYVNRDPTHPKQDPLLKGDVFVALNGHALDLIKTDQGEFGNKRLNLEDYLKDIKKTVLTDWTVWRNGQELTLKREIVPDEGDIDEIESNPYFFIGHVITPELAQRLDLEAGIKGVYIELAPSQRKQEHPYKFKSGMVVTSVNGVVVDNTETLTREINKAKKDGKALVFEVIGNAHWGTTADHKILFSEVYLKGE